MTMVRINNAFWFWPNYRLWSELPEEKHRVKHIEKNVDKMAIRIDEERNMFEVLFWKKGD